MSHPHQQLDGPSSHPPPLSLSLSHSLSLSLSLPLSPSPSLSLSLPLLPLPLSPSPHLPLPLYPSPSLPPSLPPSHPSSPASMEGGTLATMLVERGSVPEDETAALIQKLVQGLQYLHDANIIHTNITVCRHCAHSHSPAVVTLHPLTPSPHHHLTPSPHHHLTPSPLHSLTPLTPSPSHPPHPLTPSPHHHLTLHPLTSSSSKPPSPFLPLTPLTPSPHHPLTPSPSHPPHPLTPSPSHPPHPPVAVTPSQPDNLLLSHGQIDLKIADFRLARLIEGGNQLDEVGEAPAYMSPEAVSLKPLTTATDVWSAGAVAFHL